MSVLSDVLLVPVSDQKINIYRDLKLVRQIGIPMIAVQAELIFDWRWAAMLEEITDECFAICALCLSPTDEKQQTRQLQLWRSAG